MEQIRKPDADVVHKPLVLVIDDSREILTLLEHALARDFNVQTSTSGGEGLGLAMRQAPDLVLLDILMPDAHGFDIYRQLRAVKRLHSVPVIFVSGIDELDTVAQGLALGAADYLVKPFNVSLVRQRIVNLLERDKLRKDLETHRDRLQETVVERTKELVVAKRSAEAANHAKSLFLSKLGSELRAPLAAILGMIDLAQRTAVDGSLAMPLGEADKGARHLLRMIEELLDFAQLEVRSMTLDNRAFRLDQLVQGVLEQTAAAAEEKGLRLDVAIAPELAGRTVEGDAERLGLILRHLVDNAIRFTAQGGVDIRVAAVDAASDALGVRFAVSDSGIGIAEDQRQRLFCGFEQADPTSDGLGLGLAICQRLASMMGGVITVDSSPGAGSVFALTVRLAGSDKVPAADFVRGPRGLAAKAGLRRRHGSSRVLLIGGDPINREVMAWMLVEVCIPFDVAGTVEAALEMIRASAYDAILIDLGLFESDDLQVVSAIRAIPGRKHTAIVGLTGRPLGECRKRGEEAGISGLLATPIDAGRFFETLLLALDDHKTGPALKDQRFQMLADIARELEGDIVFPTSLEIGMHIRRYLERPAAPFSGLVDLIMLEPLIACKVIQAANALSGDAASPQVRSDIRSAVRILGETEVRAIAARTVAAQQALTHRLPEFQKKAVELWRHSIDTAAAAYVLGRHATLLNPEECFLAGLVHDIGGFYMIYRANQYAELRLRPDSACHLATEWHESIGLSVLGAHKVGESVIDAVRDHHRPQWHGRLAGLADVVQLANRLAEHDGIGRAVSPEGTDDGLDDYRRRFGDEIREQARRLRAVLPDMPEAARAVS